MDIKEAEIYHVMVLGGQDGSGPTLQQYLNERAFVQQKLVTILPNGLDRWTVITYGPPILNLIQTSPVVEETQPHGDEQIAGNSGQ